MVDPSPANLSRCKARALVVDPSAAIDDDYVTEWPTVGPLTGFSMLAQSLICCPGECRARRSTGPSEEVLFVIAGEGFLTTGADSHRLDAECGAYLAPGVEYEVESGSDGALRLVRTIIPDPVSGRPGLAHIRRLADQVAQPATTEREFRIVADPATGLRSATHFVGYVPTARAPEHFHTYDELIYILDGEGELHAGDLHHPVRAGSSIQLPARTVHCLENTGREVMRLVAVFRPAGSPADAYYPDGTPAHPGAPPIAE